MKFWTFLFATFILFLAIKPGIDLISFQEDTEQTCCDGQCLPTSDNSQSEKQAPGNSCEGKFCNPFQVCSSCVLLCLNVPLDFVSVPKIFSEKGFTYQSIFTSQFASDFWQPPKIV